MKSKILYILTFIIVLNTGLSAAKVRVGRAAVDAALQPATLIPFALATFVAIAGWDDNFSAWATKHANVFGSVNNAKNFSDVFMGLNLASIPATVLPIPKDTIIWNQPVKKLAILGIDVLAVGTTWGVTGVLKLTGRERPDASNKRSFPSGHASVASVSGAVSSRNLNFTSLTNKTKTPIRIGLYTFTYLTGWARIEAKKHWLTDVLVGIGLGQFIGDFTYNSVIEYDKYNDDVTVSVWPYYDGLEVTLQKRF